MPRQPRCPARLLPDEPRSVLQAFLLVTIYLALQVDVFVARVQRRQLGLCVDCGGVNDPASCPQPQCPLRIGNGDGS